MVTAPEPAEPALRQVAAWLRRMPGRAVLELASRVGYAARGVVYLSVGVVALLAALDLTPRATGAVGAMQAWGEWPAGVVLILLVGWGLLGFAAWRGLQAVFDADGHGHGARGLAVRAGQAVSGLVHGALAFSVFQLADGIQELHEVDEEGAARETAARILEAPGGEWVLIVAGLFTLGVGLANLAQAAFRKMAGRLQPPGETRPWLGALGRFGYFGRGVAFAPLGLLIADSGFDARAGDAQGLGGVLQMLERQPFGSWVLSLTAVGLIAFGLFALAEARYRRIDIPSP